MRKGKFRVGTQEWVIILLVLVTLWSLLLSYYGKEEAKPQQGILIMPFSSVAASKQYEDTNTEHYSMATQVKDREPEAPSRGSGSIPVVVTAYTCGIESTGKAPGHPDFCRTASGYVLSAADANKAVAADPRYYPLGTKLYLDGVGVVTVRDTGGDIKGPNRIDLFVAVTDTTPAYAWGVRRTNIRRL